MQGLYLFIIIFITIYSFDVTHDCDFKSPAFLSLQRLNNNHYTTDFSANEHKHGLNASNDYLRQQELAQKAEKAEKS